MICLKLLGFPQSLPKYGVKGHWRPDCNEKVRACHKGSKLEGRVIQIFHECPTSTASENRSTIIWHFCWPPSFSSTSLLLPFETQKVFNEKNMDKWFVFPLLKLDCSYSNELPLFLAKSSLRTSQQERSFPWSSCSPHICITLLVENNAEEF